MRKTFCQACSNEQFGVRTRISVEHTCERNSEVNKTQHTSCPDCKKQWNESEQEYQNCEGCGFPMMAMPNNTGRMPLGYNEQHPGSWDRAVDDDIYD
jgi:predicted amidophosphoribosyltransferase